MRVLFFGFSRWVVVAGWCVLIALSVVGGRRIVTLFQAWPYFSLGVNLFLGSCFFLAVGAHLRRAGPWQHSQTVLLAGLLAGAVWGLKCLPRPEERLHLLEYGGLAALLLWAFAGHKLSLKISVILAFLVAGVFGWMDECVQGILPDRYFQWSDVGLNVLSAAWGLTLAMTLRWPGELFSKK